MSDEKQKEKLPATQDFPIETNHPTPNDTARQIAEIQAQVVMAKKFPRDENQALIRIKKACERKSLAEKAQFAFPRAGSTISGPTIRLLEAVAQAWGNIDYGIREIANDGEWAEAESYAWDLESNTMIRKRFKVKLEVALKNGGVKKLKDPRDIYEHVANFGMRRVRACLEGVIPADVVEDAEAACKRALTSSTEPLHEQIKRLLFALDKLGVSKEMIEKRLGHSTDLMIGDQVAEYGRIFNSLKDGITKREDWFDYLRTPEESDKLKGFKGKFKKDEIVETPEVNSENGKV